MVTSLPASTVFDPAGEVVFELSTRAPLGYVEFRSSLYGPSDEIGE